MKLLANEHIPLRSIEALREAGHDVLAIGETEPGLEDASIMKRAAAQDRIILTSDPSRAMHAISPVTTYTEQPTPVSSPLSSTAASRSPGTHNPTHSATTVAHHTHPRTCRLQGGWHPDPQGGWHAEIRSSRLLITTPTIQVTSLDNNVFESDDHAVVRPHRLPSS